MRLTVLLVAHNDGRTLSATIEPIAAALTQASIPHEILVIDDHSTDGTADVLRLLSTKVPTLRSRFSSNLPGYGNTIRAGLEDYTGDAICIVPADGSAKPGDIVTYYRMLGSGADCVFGMRAPRAIRAAERIFNAAIRLLFNISYGDVTHIFKCYVRGAIERLKPLVSQGTEIALELPLKAILRGSSYCATPVTADGRGDTLKARNGRPVLLTWYLLLEKHLMRADTDAGGRARQSMLVPWLAFLFVVLGHVLFIKTYPLNYEGGDAGGYYYLLIHRLSNLCFAPGYPFLAGLPISISSVSEIVSQHESAFRALLLRAQHVFDLACLAVFMLVLSRVFNRLTAVITVLIAGLGIRGMGATSSVYPEWLQADLLILSISFAIIAWRTSDLERKTMWYTLAYVAFIWSYLTKFNGIVFLPFLVIAVLAERLPWKRRLTILATASAIAFLNYALFVTVYHRPKTGTYDLSYDHSWVLMTRLDVVYGGKLPYPQGIATKRWLALSSVIPQTYEGQSWSPFVSLNSPFVFPGARDPYRNIAKKILTTTDVATLDNVIRSHPLPNFEVKRSSIPISWFVGLKESDQLGVRVFRESVLHHPRPFVTSTLRATYAALTRPIADRTLYATTENLPHFSKSVTRSGTEIRLVEFTDYYRYPYGYGDVPLWSPGVTFFSVLSVLTKNSGQLLMIIIVCGLLAGIANVIARGWSDREAIQLLLAAFFFGFVVFSCAVLDFRWKEMRFVLPVCALLVGIAVGHTLPETVRLITRLSFPSRRAPTTEALNAGDPNS